MNLNPAPSVPRLALLALTLVVLLVHGWLLEAAPRSLGAGPQAPADVPVSFVTRTIMARPATPPPRAAPREAPRPQPKQVATPVAAVLPQPTAQLITSGASQEALPPTEPEPFAGQEPLAAADAVATSNTAVAAAAQDLSPEVKLVSSSPAQAEPPAPALPEASPPLAPAAKLPPPMRLKYVVQANKFPFSLNAELLWQHDGTDYNARLAYSAFGQSRVQTSQGKVGGQGLAPVRFSDKYRTELAAHFNRDTGKITFSANTPDAPMLAGAQDRLSVLVQLATLIGSDPGGYPQATTITLQTAGPREASPWLFTVQAPETLVLPGGEQATLKLVRLPRRDYDQKVELWLAPVLGYLPARIRITEHNDDYIDQQWQATEP